MGCASSKQEAQKPVETKKETVVEKIEEAVVEELEACCFWEPCLYPEYCDECNCVCGRAGTCIALFAHKTTGQCLSDTFCCNCGEITNNCSKSLTATTKKERAAAEKKAADAKNKKKTAPPKAAPKK